MAFLASLKSPNTDVSSTAALLYISYFIHNVIAWLKIRPFLPKWGARAFIISLLAVQPYWVLETWANFQYHNQLGNRLFDTSRLFEPLGRDPWWVFTTIKLVLAINENYDFTIPGLIRTSPRFGIMLLCLFLSIIFLITDVIFMIVVSKRGGMNPFWRLALVFKCASDVIFLDDFKSVLDRISKSVMRNIATFEYRDDASPSVNQRFSSSFSTPGFHRKNSRVGASRAEMGFMQGRTGSRDDGHYEFAAHSDHAFTDEGSPRPRHGDGTRRPSSQSLRNREGSQDEMLTIYEHAEPREREDIPMEPIRHPFPFTNSRLKMVKIAIAGASGQVAREILDKLVETGKHEILGLVRRDPASLPSLPNVRWVQTTYDDKQELVKQLRGVETVLSFITNMDDPTATAEKRLIDAAIEAGVKRFAPGEWAIGENLVKAIDAVPWYQGKLATRKYLRELNQKEKVLEYCLFQPGQFTNYYGYPHQTTKHISISPFMINLDSMRAVLDEDHKDAELSLTTADDLGNVVVRAVDYPGEWPEVGGITGTRIKIPDLLALGEKIRGKSFTIEWVKNEDLKNGVLKVERLPELNHPVLASLSKEQLDGFRKGVLIGTVLLASAGAWAVTDEWNQLLPDYKFTQVEDFLRQVWAPHSEV
ncbi:hypothetical protein NM208_g15508 [Fusarium decemcellulare]|uniref:Uncharacterized protein n=1 Tax=Fusarium decemcellulare TaxID=57161 RepID=A0ACC1RG78_9HYPO|nr:hypothetical protein NM208_g15508 [Fusarium decemcellulare]